MPKKRADGKSELLLKNGTSFIGTIISENNRYLQFSTSDGATINIIRRLIKEIDGVPYVITTGTAAAPTDTSMQLQRPGSGGTSAAASPTKQASVEKPTTPAETGTILLPHVEIKAGISSKELVDSLKSASSDTRSMAARRLGAMGQWATGTIPYLVALLGDTARADEPIPPTTDSVTIQKLLAPGYEASRSLSRMGGQAFEELKKSARGAPLVRQRAVFGLGCSRDPARLSLLREATKDPEPGVRACGAWGLRMNGAVDALTALMNDRDGDVRAYAAASLASLADPGSANVMIAALKDMRPQVRMFAAAGLGRIKTPNAIPVLIKALNDVSPDVRSETAQALGLIADSASVNPLCGATKDNNLQVRKNAILALGEILDPRAIPTLYSAIQESRDTLRPVIEQVLKRHTEIPLLIAALDNGKPVVRENAAYILWLMTGKDLGQDKQAWTDWYSKEGITGKQPVKAEAEKQKKEKPAGKK